MFSTGRVVLEKSYLKTISIDFFGVQFFFVSTLIYQCYLCISQLRFVKIPIFVKDYYFFWYQYLLAYNGTLTKPADQNTLVFHILTVFYKTYSQ